MNPIARHSVLALLLLPSGAHAIEVSLPLRDVVVSSDYIVIASPVANDDVGGNGDIGGEHFVVDRVIWGNAKPGDILPSISSNFVSLPKIYPELNGGRSLLFMLATEADGSVRVDRSERVLPAADLETVLDTLAAYPYQVIAPDRDLGDSSPVEIIFRNATPRRLNVPKVTSSDGQITHGDNFELRVETARPGPGDPHSANRGQHIRRDATPPALELRPGQSIETRIPYAELAGGLAPGLQIFDVTVNGYSTQHRFIVRTRWLGELHRVKDTPKEMVFYVQTLRNHEAESRQAIDGLMFERVKALSVAPELMSMCDSLATPLRRQLMVCLTTMDIPPREGLDFFLERVDDPDTTVRDCALSGAYLAARASGDYRRSEIVDRVMVQLDDEDPTVREQAATTVSNLRIAEALPVLKRLVQYDGDESVRAAAAWAIEVLENRDHCSGRPLSD